MKSLNQQTIERLIFMLVFILLFMLFFWLFFLTTHYIHETGHILFGFANGLLKGKVNSFDIGNWVGDPLTHFIPLPQQTRIIDGTGSLNFRLGGPLLTMIVFLGLSAFGYMLSKKKAWFLLFFAIVLFEVSGNIICGTDNFYGYPLSMCNPALDISLQILSIFLFAVVLAWEGMGRVKRNLFNK